MVINDGASVSISSESVLPLAGYENLLRLKKQVDALKYAGTKGNYYEHELIKCSERISGSGGPLT